VNGNGSYSGDKMEKKLNIEKLRKSKKFVYYHDDFQENLSKEDVKKIRQELKMSQAVFATVIGVSKKTIEKWEQGKNPVSGPAAKLIYLIRESPEIVKKFYDFEVIEDEFKGNGNASYNYVYIQNEMKNVFFRDAEIGYEKIKKSIPIVEENVCTKDSMLKITRELVQSNPESNNGYNDMPRLFPISYGKEQIIPTA